MSDQFVEVSKKEPYLIQGLLEGCTYPINSLSISYFRSLFGDLYQVYVYDVRNHTVH